MKLTSRTVLVSACTLLLTQCGGQQTNEPESTANVSGARNALLSTVQTGTTFDVRMLRPGALLGTYIAHFLVHNSIFQGAIEGIQAHMSFLFDDESEKTESFELLEDLGTILQVDVPDMLNRSTNRARTFDAYVESLEDSMRRGNLHVTLLEQELKDLNNERRTARRSVSDIQRTLNNALRNQDYSTASGLQQQLIAAEGDVTEIEAKVDEKNDIINLFEELLVIGNDRLNAMRANREALLAGIKVTELPGIEGLGILEKGRGSRNRRNIFDLNGN